MTKKVKSTIFLHVTLTLHFSPYPPLTLRHFTGHSGSHYIVHFNGI